MTTPDPYAVPPPEQPYPGQPYPGQPAPGQPYPPPPPPPYGSPPPYGYPQQGYPPQGYPPPGYGYQTPPRKPVDGVSVAALVFGLIGIWVVGLICAILGIRRTRPDSPQRGRGLAVAGLILSCLWAFLQVVVVAGLIAFAHSGTGHQVSDVLHGKRILVMTMTRGDCYEWSRDAGTVSTYGPITNVRKQDCASAHDAQVIDTFDVDSGGSYPGTDGLASQAQTRCADRFDAAKAHSPRSEDLQLIVHVPTQFLWDASGDQGTVTVICSVRHVAGSSSGSLTSSYEAPTA